MGIYLERNVFKYHFLHHFIFKILIFFINTTTIDKILHKIQIKEISVSWL
jgi:hypothetical protein